MTSPLDAFGPLTRAWFASSFEAPTEAQLGAWNAISDGDNALVIAPTGSGKTLAAFLWAIDRLTEAHGNGTRVLYVSPLKALAVDIERNLRSPLSGIRAAAARMDVPAPQIDVAVRTGDTPAEDRRRFVKHPPDILITTPESLFLMLTSRAREALTTVDTVIIDEVHAIAGTKRGSHLALSLERLDHLLESPAQRIGLSATVRPPEEVARFLGGTHDIKIITAPHNKELDLKVVVPVEDLSAIGDETGEFVSGSAAGAEARTSIWPHVEERVLELVRAHRSTIIFANSRRLSERLCARLNELAGEDIARAHHGSVSREQRVAIEDALKSGRLPAVVATSSLELGIDMGAVDLVIQVEAPDSVASGMQRVGRAGHQVGAVSRGIIFPKFRGDLVECAVVVERMKAGDIETMTYPRNPLDVLAQQVVAAVAMDEWHVDELEAMFKRAAPFHDLPRSAYEGVLDMLSGRYPSEEFAELRARIDWDRATGTLTARSSAQRLAVISGGTIPDRGLFGVFTAGEKPSRVGELDEEMVYESRPGEVFLLGASSWLIEDITHDRVIVSPAPGSPGKMPFWHGDALGRPFELGRAVGAFIREVSSATDRERKHRLTVAGLDELASNNLIAYLEEQKQATGVVPDDRTIVVERFRDELGDWRVCIHSPFGARLHAPWAQAITARLRDDLGLEVQTMHSDDGIVVRVPDALEVFELDSILFDPEDIEDLVIAEVGNSALFASRFRECAARALLLPRRRPGSRTPLWLQRQKSSFLLQVARKYESFPIVLESYREALQDVFDLPGLVELMSLIRRREVRVVEVTTDLPSPFASSLQFGYIGAFLYEGDAPLAERRAQALSLDRSLLAELMGREELRELISADAITSLELELQLLVDERKIRTAEGLQDALRNLGDLTESEITERSARPEEVRVWIDDLHARSQAIAVRIAGEERWIAVEDAARYRDAVGVALPMGLPEVLLDPVPDPIGDLIGRFARSRGPFTPDEAAQRFSMGVAVAEAGLRRLQGEGRVLEGEFKPQGQGREWVDAEVLRRLRRRSLAALRKEVEPSPRDALARFLLGWHGVGPHGPREASSAALYRVVEQLQGVPIPASVLETHVLPARLPGYRAGMLDELGVTGEVVWAGAGAIGSDDGWVTLALADKAELLLPLTSTEELSPVGRRIYDALSGHGAMFFRGIAQTVGSTDDAELLLGLWETVWAGLVTNDTFAPLRALGGPRPSRTVGPPRRRRPNFPRSSGPPSTAGRWSVLATREGNATRRRHAQADQLLSRHGIVTRGSIAPERLVGGFAGVYAVLSAFEDSGSCRRGYFVEGLGASQFALPGAVDRMRAVASASDEHTYVLTATDPANPYGAALEWPDRGDKRSSRRSRRGVGADGEDSAGQPPEGGLPENKVSGHRPARKAGSLVVVQDGHLVLYVEKGGRTLLSYSNDEATLQRAADALALAAREGMLGRLDVHKADGEEIADTPLASALVNAGFRPSSRGLRLRA
ncbi:MAG TPA: DEAD/DEAH box helicase [Actinomycetota bacterium]|nr:DEAD/DEAH box helicase [Actinomycetota bacterium]